ncbi:MAG: hypothetical protein H6994_03235 [Pseudomonadales bacterium]|nr:hypothetical protein [Pseudomonadales bacterium]
MPAQRLQRFEGRLFTEDGCLFMVVGVDDAAGTARISCRLDGHLQIIDMPLADVARRIGACTAVVMDNLNSPETQKRLQESKDGWYFTAREGKQGPFATASEAASQLCRYILRMQTVPVPAMPRTGTPLARDVASAPLPRRRVADARSGVSHHV